MRAKPPPQSASVDYVLLMTATPKDHDAERFAKATGYQLKPPAEWASVSRREGIAAQLLKRSVNEPRSGISSPPMG